MQSLSIVLPAFNERDNVEQCVGKALEVASEISGDFEVIVVDDGSSDGTADVIAPLLGERRPNLRLVCHRVNSGYGAALRTGFAHARGDLVFFTDADNQFDISELKGFIPLLDRADVIVGFRVYRFDPVLRSILSWGYNQLVRVLFRVRVRDVDCAFKLFRREVLERIELRSTDFFVDTELMAKARLEGYTILEKGVRHYPRTAGETTVRASHIPRTLVTVARIWAQIHLPGRDRKPQSPVDAEEILPEPA